MKHADCAYLLVFRKQHQMLLQYDFRYMHGVRSWLQSYCNHVTEALCILAWSCTIVRIGIG